MTKNYIKKYIAINEVSILRQSRQTASLEILNGSQKIIKKLVSDGVLVSTPAGSTAYNMSVYGPILNLDSKKLSVRPISAFRPRRWKGRVVSDKSKIIIKNLNIKKRPISAVADNYEVRNAKTISISINKKIKFREKVKIAIQINGKTKQIIEINKDLNEQEIFNEFKNEKVYQEIINKKVVKTIFVKNRIINYLIN